MNPEEELREILQRFRCVACHASGEPLDLAGGYHTALCMDCRNRWHAYCDSRPEFVTMCIAVDEREAIMEMIKTGQNRRDELKRAGKEMLETRTAMWKVAEAWVFQARESAPKKA